MCEEIKNASIIVPKSVMISVGINGTLAFTMLIAVFYCIGSLDDALNTSTDYPFMEIFVQATNSVAGAAIMASIITIMQICAVVANLASASRMYWSFSRDRAVPGWSFFVKVRDANPGCHASAHEPRYRAGQQTHDDTASLRLLDRHDFFPALAHQLRELHRLQRRRLARYRGSLRIVLTRGVAPALPPLHR